MRITNNRALPSNTWFGNVPDCSAKIQSRLWCGRRSDRYGLPVYLNRYFSALSDDGKVNNTQISLYWQFFTETDGRLIIPLFQRRYCWDEKTLSKWFEDVVRGKRDIHGTHNTGNVILKKTRFDRLACTALVSFALNEFTWTPTPLAFLLSDRLGDQTWNQGGRNGGHWWPAKDNHYMHPSHRAQEGNQ